LKTCNYGSKTCEAVRAGINFSIMFRIIDEPKNEAGMIAKCAWCGGPVEGKGMGKIWLGIIEPIVVQSANLRRKRQKNKFFSH
jgi:hypothetical protein